MCITHSNYSPNIRKSGWIKLASVLSLALLGSSVALAANTLSQQPAPSMFAQSAQTQYLIQPDDVIDITVLGQDDLTKTVTVLPDGTISYPCLGHAHVAGMTLPDLQATITRAVSTDLVNPAVTVGISQTHINQVGVLGAVKEPGKIAMKDGWHVLDAVAAAGGLTVDRPEYVSATLVRSGTQMMPIDIAQLMEGTPDQSAKQNIAVIPGDVLLVQQRDPGLTQVQVLGEVAHPGYWPASPTGSISAVLSEAGGATADGALSKAAILHDGVSAPVDLSRLGTDGTVAGSLTLQPGDTLVVPQNKSWYAVYGAVEKPGYIIYPDGQSVTVMTALSQAGGQTDDADLAKTSLITVTDGQTSTVTHLDVQALIARGDATQNVEVPTDSILYIPVRGEKNRAHITDLFPLAAFFNAVHL